MAEWEEATQHARQLAIAADAELHRRHPSQPIDPLRSAEPEILSETQREALILVPGQDIGQMTQWIEDLGCPGPSGLRIL